MSLKRLRTLFGAKAGRREGQPGRDPRRRVLSVEQLEDRVVPAYPSAAAVPIDAASPAAGVRSADTSPVAAVAPVQAELTAAVTAAALRTPVPVSPSGLTARSNLTLAWKPVPQADAYRYRVIDVTSGQPVVVERRAVAGVPGELGRAAVRSVLIRDHVYQWSVRAISADGRASPWSAPVTFRAVRVTGLTPSAPSSTLDVSITGVKFNPALATTLVATYPTGQAAKLGNIHVTSSSKGTTFSFAAPTFIDLLTGQSSAGSVQLRLKQRTVRGTLRSVNLGTLQIQDLPETGLPPGTVLNQFTEGAIQLVTRQINNIQNLGDAGGFDVSDHVAQLQDTAAQMTAFQGQLQRVLNGDISEFSLGQLGSTPVVMNADALAFADRQIAALALNSGLGDASASSSSLRARSLAASSVSAALTVSDVTTAVTNVLDRMSKNAQSEDFKKIGEIASTTAGTIGLIAAAGLAAPIVVEAGVVAGIVATTAKVLTVVVPLADQLIHNVAGDQTSTAIDYTKLRQDIKELAVDLTLKAGANELKQIKLQTQDMERLTDIVEKGIDLFDGLAGLTGQPTTSKRIVDQVEDAFTQIKDALLARPDMGVSPGSLDFTQGFGGDPPDSQTLVVTNTGRGTLNFTVTGPSWITVTGGGPLGAGESASLTVSADSGGLPPGEYDDVITIQAPDAVTPEVTVQVHLTVVTGEALVVPDFLSLTAEQGEVVEGEFSVTNVGEDGTVLHYSISTSDGHVTVVGAPTDLAAGQSDDFTVLVDTSDLSADDSPYVFFVDVTNLDLAPDDPNRVQTLTISLVVNRPAAVIGVDPSSFDWTIDPESPFVNELIVVSNAGPDGSLLSWSWFSPSGRASISDTPDIPGGWEELLVFSYDASGLAPGNYTDSITIYSTDDDRVADVTIQITFTIPGETETPAWGAYESGANGRSSDQWYSISSAEMSVRFWMQPFALADQFVVTDDFGNVYVDVNFSTEDQTDDVPLQEQHPQFIEFTKPEGVTRLRVQVISSGGTSGWWYKGVAPGELWY